MKVSELKDELLDYWVAKANGVTEVHVVDAWAIALKSARSIVSPT